MSRRSRSKRSASAAAAAAHSGAARVGARLVAQRLAGEPLTNVETVVALLGAVQAQDYDGAKWSVGQRGTGVTSRALDAAFNEGRILRTHVLRPTWHFVLPRDIRWLLALTSPRVDAANGHMYRRLELDGRTLARTQRVIVRALEGGRHRTRQQIADVLRSAGIEASGQRLAYIMMRAELDALVCSGPRIGRQFTYALLHERAPAGSAFEGDDALAELAVRFFASRGPATIRDFAWWASLTMADARRAPELAGDRLTSIVAEDVTFWCAPDALERRVRPAAPALHLLPAYDEFLVACRDDAAAFHVGVREQLRMTADVLRPHVILVDGRLAGGWSRRLLRSRAELEAELLVPLRRREQRALKQAAAAYGRFLEMEVELNVV